MDNIIFDSTFISLTLDFGELMKSKFDMSIIEELIFFLGFQVQQCDNGIFISKSTYAWNFVKKFKIVLGKYTHTPTPISKNTKLNKEIASKSVDQTFTGVLLVVFSI